MADGAPATEVSLEVLQHLCASLPADETPRATAWSTALDFDNEFASQLRHIEREAYSAELKEELSYIAKLEPLIAFGKTMCHMLYCFRNAAAAVPQKPPPNAPADFKMQTHIATVQVLRPEVAKLHQLQAFTEEINREFVAAVQFVIRREAQPKPRLVYAALASLVDVALSLDVIRDLNPSIANTFSVYRRAFTVAARELPDADAEQREIDKLQEFLNNMTYPHHPITLRLKGRIKEITMYDQVLIEILKLCVNKWDQKTYVTAADKHSLIRAMAGLVMMIDDTSPNPKTLKTVSIFFRKDLPRDQIFAIFKSLPIVPVYADMALVLKQLLGQCHSAAGIPLEDYVGDQPSIRAYLERGGLGAQWQSMRSDCIEFQSQFTRLLNQLSVITSDREGTGRINAISQPIVNEAFALALQGLRMVATCVALGGNDKLPTFQFEQAVKYNYSAAERAVLIDVIGMIKSTGSMLRQAAAVLSPIFRMAMFADIQDFAHGILTESLAKSAKKSVQAEEALLRARQLAADWPAEAKAREDEYKDSKKSGGADRVVPPRRVVAPSVTQCQALRAAVLNIIDPASAALSVSKGMFSTKVFNSDRIRAFEEFATKLEFIPYLADFNSSIRRVTDLGALWYRERCLAMARVVQFECTQSLPCILATDATKCEAQATSQSLFYVLDVYNDAGHAALYEFRQRFLFDEIEAEVQVMFVEIVNSLAENVYNMARDIACEYVLPRKHRDTMHSMGVPPQTARRLDALLSQRHFDLLGRSVNLTDFLRHEINLRLHADTETALQRMEHDGFSGFLEYEMHLAVLRKIHSLLSPYLELDPFNVLVADEEDRIVPVSVVSRISQHVCSLLPDLFTTYAFNTSTERFVRTVKAARRRKQPLVGPAYAPIFNSIFRRRRAYVGTEHISAVVRLLGPVSLSGVMDYVLRRIIVILQSDMAEESTVLLDNVEPIDRLPQHKFGLVVGYFALSLKIRNLTKTSDLIDISMPLFTELGNALAFLYLLQQAQKEEEARAALFLQPLASPPDPSALETSLRQAGMLVSGNSASAGQFMSLPVHGRTALGSRSAEALVGTVPALVSKLRASSQVLNVALSAINEILDVNVNVMGESKPLREHWSTPPGMDDFDVVIKPDTTSSFWRLWSALVFAYCLPKQEGTSTVVFESTALDSQGDGFLWAGCALVHLLNQRRPFEIRDFTSHLLATAHLEEMRAPTDNAASEMDLKGEQASAAKQFITTGNYVRQRLDLIFSILEAANDAHMQSSAFNTLEFSPPDDDSDIFASLITKGVSTSGR